MFEDPRKIFVESVKERKRNRCKISLAARNAVSDRIRKYWAERRKAKKG